MPGAQGKVARRESSEGGASCFPPPFLVSASDPPSLTKGQAAEIRPVKAGGRTSLLTIAAAFLKHTIPPSSDDANATCLAEAHMVICMDQWFSVLVHSWKCVIVCMCMRMRVRMLIQHGTYDVCVHGYVGLELSKMQSLTSPALSIRLDANSLPTSVPSPPVAQRTVINYL